MAAVTPATWAAPPASPATLTTTPPPKPPLALPASPWIPLRLIDLDASFSLWIYTACLPIPRSLLKTLEISGDGRFWFPIPISLLPFSRSSPILIGLIFGSLLDLALIGLIKHIVRRPRPVYNKGMHLTFAVDHWSFPSGHSSRVFFIAAFLCLCADPLRLLLRSHRWVQGCYGGRHVQMTKLKSRSACANDQTQVQL